MHMPWPLESNTTRNPSRRRAVPPGIIANPVLFETLEPRLLMNASPIGIMAGTVATTPAIVLSAGLAHDTGTSTTISQDPTIAGHVASTSGVVALTACIDGLHAPTIGTVPTLVHHDGSFTLSLPSLQALAGGHLADGTH